MEGVDIMMKIHLLYRGWSFNCSFRFSVPKYKSSCSQSKEGCWLSKFCLFWYWKMGETVEKIPCIVNWRDDDHGKLCDDDDGMFILIIYLELLLEWCDCYCVACHHCHIMINISIKYSIHLRKWSEAKESYFWRKKWTLWRSSVAKLSSSLTLQRWG